MTTISCSFSGSTVATARSVATAAALELEATSADRSVLDALEHAVAHAHLTRDLIPDHLDGQRVDLSFASENWRDAILPRKHPGRLVRRHFEACVFTYLSEELRTGDIAVAGSYSYANWAEHLLPWEECVPLLDGFCAEVDLPADATAFTQALRARLEQTAAETDAGYPDNADLVIDEQGAPTLKRRSGKQRRDSAIELEEQIKQRMPERSLLGILARTAHWLGWWRRFGPLSGSDPKLNDPIGRYILEVMPRIRNWKDLIFFRASEHARYMHIDSLFGDPGRNAIDWTLIETHWTDLMQVALSIREGKLSSVLLLRRLGSNSRKNSIYKAFRELGRVIRTIQMLRFISDPMLRERVTAATNKVEAYNGYTSWLRFGNAGVIAANDPVEQEKTIKFNQLLANCAIFHTTVDMMTAIRELQADGWPVTTDDLADVSPYVTENIKRFGEYPTDELGILPADFDPRLDLPARGAERTSAGSAQAA